MRFVETPIFTRLLRRRMAGDDYRAMQLAPVFRPDGGFVIPGSGGLRKIRWGSAGRGKRGGVRVICFWPPATDTIHPLYGFSKRRRGDLSKERSGVLRRLVQEEFE